MLKADKHEIANILRNAGHVDTEVARRAAILSVIGQHALGERLRMVAENLEKWRAEASRKGEAEDVTGAWLRGEPHDSSPQLADADAKRQNYDVEYSRLIAEILTLADRIEEEGIA